LFFILLQTILSVCYSKDEKSLINYEKQKAKVDLLNEQSVKYLQTDFPKAIITAQSALKIAMDINYPKGEADALFNSANSTASQSSVTQDMAILKKALKIYRKINEHSKIAKILNRISLHYYHLQNYTKSYNYSTDALKIYEKLSDELGIADSYLMIGKIYNVWNMTNNAKEALGMSKQLYYNSFYYKGIADVLIQQGNLASQLGDKQLAKKCYTNAIYLYKKSDCPTGLSDSYNVMSTYYSDYELNMLKSYHFMDKAIKISENIKDSSRLASFLTHKSHLYSLDNNHKASLQYDLRALEIRKKLKQQLAVGSSYINLGSNYISLKDYTRAEKNILEGFRISKKGGIIFFSRRAAIMLNKLYTETNQHDKALLYLDSAYKLTLIINQEEKQHQKSLVDAERKLRIEEHKISLLENKRNTSFRNMLWIIILLGASSSILFFYLYSSKKKDNQKLRIQSKELEASELRYRNLIDTATDLIYSIDAKGRFLSLNSAFETITGYAVKDFLGKEFAPLIHKDDLEKANETFYKTLKGEPLEPYVLRILIKNGDYLYGEFTSKELVQDGKIVSGFGIARDITTKIIAEEALKASEERYRVFINSTDDMAFLKDDKFRYLIVNNPYVEFFAKPEQYILGKTDFELMPPDAAENCNKTDQLAAKSNTIVVNEEEAFGKIYETHKFRVTLGDGSYGIGGYIRDITERKQAEADLKKSEALYSTLIGNMNEGLMHVDNEDIILFVNKKICEIFGYVEEELIGKTGNDIIIFSEDKFVVLEHNKNRLEKIAELYEVRGVKKSGEIIWLNISGSPILDEQGKTIGSVGLISDITDRKKAEEQLKNEKRFSDFLIESLPGLFYMFDSQLKPVRWNKNKMEFLGLNTENMQNHNILDSIADEDKAKLISSIEKTMTIGEDQDIIKIIKHDGDVFSYHLTGKRLITDSGAFLMGVGIDVTDRVKIENELITAKIKAEESERLKSSFLANMSHELRTPMVGILGFSQLLADVENLEKAKEMGEVINSSGKRLMETLNLILDLARIEAGESEVEIYEIDLMNSINEVIIVFDVIAKTKNIVLKSYSDFENYIIYTSPKIITSVLNNLINNAVKFTNAGSIIVTLENEILNGQTSAIIKVADTGIGIEKKDLANIFDEFRQASEGLGRSHEGTGLGLTLCKKYVEMLGGNISVESNLGVGTVFTIRIPDMNTSSVDESIDIMQSEPKLSIKAPQSPKDFNCRILVVDDDQTSVYLVERILGNQFFIDSVNNSVDAIEKVKENQYALILMDINLGKSKNGLYATGEIRKLENYRNIPIIAMTAYAMIGDKEEFISKGCTGYISKPYTKEQLFNLILEFI
jgi:PAS domain S-box-containing protein